MINTITSLTNSALKDWLVQRVTAVIITAYILCWLWLGCTLVEELSYDVWVELFSMPWLRYFSVLFLLSLIAHAWVGMWTVYTDYIKGAILRLVVQVVTIVAMLSFVIWGIFILWGMI